MAFVEPVQPVIPEGAISARENYHRVFEKGKPAWFPTTHDMLFFNPAILPDNIARGMVNEAMQPEPGYEGGPDMFGVNWTWVPETMGSMVYGGHPALEDANDWEKVIRFPDMEQWDWEGCAKRNAGIYFDTNRPSCINVVSGLFERLISFMDMQYALMALVDADQKDAVKRLFDRLTVFYDQLFEHLHRYFHTDVVQFHDDWGSKKAPLFSLDTCMEMVEPYLEKVVKSAHRHGMIFEFHCCGKNELLVPAMYKANIDIWNGQPLNDFDSLIPVYGDKIVFGVSPEPLPADVADEEAWESGHRFVEKYIHFYDEGKPVAVFSRRSNAKQIEAIYHYSREALSRR